MVRLWASGKREAGVEFRAEGGGGGGGLCRRVAGGGHGDGLPLVAGGEVALREGR